MRVVVVGSGLIGITTAYFLRRCGHEVTVIDREEGPGQGASFANGALLTPSMAEPWNAPGVWRVLLNSLGRFDTSMQLRLRALPSLAGWGVTFLRNSRAERFERNALSNLRLALHSIDLMQAMREQTDLDYGYSSRGSLRLFRDPAALDLAQRAAARNVAEGLRYRLVSPSEAVALEPTLAPIAHHLTGAVHYQNDEMGDALRFCVALTDLAQRQGVEFVFRCQVQALEIRSGRVTAALSEGRRYTADQYVVAAGSHSTGLLERLSVGLPVRPVKGYSLTFAEQSGLSVPTVPIVDDHTHVAITPLNGGIRVVGLADFCGYDLTLSAARMDYLLGLLQGMFPQVPWERAQAKLWCGLRPMSADGVPIVGQTRLANLWVNTGHGHLGWTLAAGSAQLLSELISGVSSTIDPSPYALSRGRG